MSLRINQNVLSLFTHSNLKKSSNRLESSIHKLSSGLRINSAADDAAGLAISEKMRSQIRGLNRASLNAQDGISMMQTAEGALNETESMLQRMRELSIQAANDTLTTNDRLEIQKEVNQLRSEVDRIAYNTEFNTKKLLNGSQTALISSSSRHVQGLVSGKVGVGGDYNVDLRLVDAGVAQVTTSQMFTTKDGELAKGSEKLQDISQFYDNNGHFVLELPQILTVTGNGKSAEVSVHGQMTLGDLAYELQNAMISQEKGLGIKNSQAQVINGDLSRDASISGYIQIVSGSIGDRGEFSIAGPQPLTDALGFSISREAKNNLVEASANIGGHDVKVSTSDHKARGLLDGVDVMFNSQAAQVATIGGVVDGLHISADSQFSVVLYNADNAITAEVAFNFVESGDWTMDGLVSAINAQIATAADSAEALSGLKASVVEGEIRLSYKPINEDAPSKFTIENASECKSIGFHDGEYTTFAQGNKNADSVIQGIKRYTADLGLNVSGFSGPPEQIRTATITVTAAGTNLGSTGDMKEITEFIKSANEQLEGASANVTVSHVNGSLAFTATRIGQDNSNNQTVRSMVEVELADKNLAGAVRRELGLGAISHSEGMGDKNFRLHVVATGAQFQIGANAGQNMKVTVGDMSAAALNIDNLDLTCIEGAEDALERVDNALAKVSAERSKIGAYINRLNYSISNVDNTATNLTAAEARIRDVDMAKEMMEYTRDQIVSQAGIAMLAQANAIPQNVLALLGQ